MFTVLTNDLLVHSAGTAVAAALLASNCRVADIQSIYYRPPPPEQEPTPPPPPPPGRKRIFCTILC
jgi:hypothetical protein